MPMEIKIAVKLKTAKGHARNIALKYDLGIVIYSTTGKTLTGRGAWGAKSMTFL